MEFIFEFLFELLIEGMAGVTGHPKIPKGVRIFFAGILCLPFFVLFVLLGFSALYNSASGGILVAVLMWAVSLLPLYAWIHIIRKIILYKPVPKIEEKQEAENSASKTTEI